MENIPSVLLLIKLKRLYMEIIWKKYYFYTYDNLSNHVYGKSIEGRNFIQHIKSYEKRYDNYKNMINIDSLQSLENFIRKFDRNFYKEMSFVIKHIDSLSDSRYDFKTRMKELNIFIEENCSERIPTIYYT